MKRYPPLPAHTVPLGAVLTVASFGFAVHDRVGTHRRMVAAEREVAELREQLAWTHEEMDYLEEARDELIDETYAACDQPWTRHDECRDSLYDCWSDLRAERELFGECMAIERPTKEPTP